MCYEISDNICFSSYIKSHSVVYEFVIYNGCIAKNYFHHLCVVVLKGTIFDSKVLVIKTCNNNGSTISNKI